jgi:predicted component of type VI protein secretion system
MSDVLVVKEGPHAGQRLELDGELVIGREGGHAPIEDGHLSRRHALVRPVDDGFELEDLGSRGGTFVNGERIESPTRIAAGDLIKVGQTLLEVTLAEKTEPEPRAAPAPPPPGATRLAPSPVPPPAQSPPAAPPPVALAPTAAPSAPFGAYAVPETKRRRGIASRQYGPLVACWLVVIATAVALAIYFSNHPA